MFVQVCEGVFFFSPVGKVYLNDVGETKTPFLDKYHFQSIWLGHNLLIKVNEMMMYA